jgi:hypothetical protein
MAELVRGIGPRPDCQGSMQTEHITYVPDMTAPICAFHNQVLRVMRLSLALSKRAVALRGKLTVAQRKRTVEVLKRHRFDQGSIERTDAYCKKLAAEQGIILGKLDYKKHRATPTRPDPVDGMRFTMSFKPGKKRGLVTCCKWDVPDCVRNASAYELADNDCCRRCVRSFALHLERCHQVLGEQVDCSG